MQIPRPQRPDVVVSVARLPPSAGEATLSVIRLDREDLDGQARLDDALVQAPAVSVFRRTSGLSANPTTQGISLRAIAPSGAGRALVTLDSVPLNDPFGGWVIWSQVLLRAAVSATEARVDSGGEALRLNGLRRAQAPIWSATAGLDWRPIDRLSLGADLRWESRRFDDNLNSRVLEAVVAADLRADWRLTGAASVWVALDNAFDEAAAVSLTGDGVFGYDPPRTLGVGLTLTR